MVSILALVHVVLSIFLVILVLIQDPKGGGAGGLFGGGGGGSNSLFGATGAPSFLAKVTRWVAVIFAGSCIAMTIFIKPGSKSVLDDLETTPASTSAPIESGTDSVDTMDEMPTETEDSEEAQPEE